MKRIEDVKIGDRFIVTPELNGFWAGEGVVSYKTTAGNEYVSLRMTTGSRKGDIGGFLYSELKEVPQFVIGAPLPTFKVGDKVKILRKVMSHENGWGNSWVERMDKEVGKIGEVFSVNDQETKKDVAVRTDTGNWGYPVFALELQGQYIIEFNNHSKWVRSSNYVKNSSKESLNTKVFTSKSEAEAEAKYQQMKSVYPYRVTELSKPTPRAFRVGDYVKVSGAKTYGWDGEGTVFSLCGGDGTQGNIGVNMLTGSYAGKRGAFSIEAITLVKAPEAGTAPTIKQELKYVDYLGQEIKVGSFIVYPGRHGSSLYVTLGIVKKLTESSNKPTLKVRSVNRLSVGQISVNSKNATLTELRRVTVVPRESVSISIRTRLEA